LFSYHQDLLLRDLIREQLLITTFDNTWMDIDPNHKDYSEKQSNNRE